MNRLYTNAVKLNVNTDDNVNTDNKYWEIVDEFNIAVDKKELEWIEWFLNVTNSFKFAPGTC